MVDLPKTAFLLCDRTDSWLTVWLNRPEARNALSNAVFQELEAVFLAAREDVSLRGITVRGKGGVFSAGGDLRMFRELFQGVAVESEDVAESSRYYGRVYRLIDSMPQFVLMLVEGAAIAGGLGLVCAADMVAVTADARFALTETTLGIPPAQIAPLIVRAVGLKTARRLMLTASRLDGEEAVRLGLADRLAADAAGLDEIEAQIRTQVLRCAPHANAVTKALLLGQAGLDDAEIIERAARAYTDCMLGAEGREGVSAFFEKRPPVWACASTGEMR